MQFIYSFINEYHAYEYDPAGMMSTRDHCSDLTQGAVICGPPSKLLTKMSRTAREVTTRNLLV